MDANNPDIPSRLRAVLCAGISKGSAIPQNGESVHYIWLNVTRNGIASHDTDAETSTQLLLNDWLNIIDESAALGAKWMIVYLDTSLDRTSDVWKICSWAQEVHSIRVGLHINSKYAKEYAPSLLVSLDKSNTFIIADKSALRDLAPFEEEGYTLCHSNIGEEDRQLPCSHTESIVCAGADGIMFCCGLVIGDETYRLGNVRSDTINNAMRNHATLQPIRLGDDHSENTCDGCPPIMAQRYNEQQQS